MRRVWLLVLLLPFLIPRCLPGLDPSQSISQYAVKHWQVEDGLPENYVTWISQSPDGYLLVGTSGGVVRFDGARFAPLAIDSPTGASREWINVVEAGAGRIWIGSRDAGMFSYSSHRAEQARDRNYQVSGMIALHDGAMAGLGGGRLYRWTADRAEVLASGLAAADPSWQGLAELPDGSIAIAAAAGALRYSGGRIAPLLPVSASPGRPLTFAAARDGGLLMGTSEGLFRVDLSGASPRITKVSQIAGPVVSALEDRDGVLWAATWGRGLFRSTRTGVSRWTARDGLADDFVHNVFEDSEGDLWVGTRAGLSRLRSGPIVPYGPAEGMQAHFFSAVTGDKSGDVWFGSWRSGLYRKHRGVIAKIPLDVPDFRVLVRALAISPQGRLWLSDWSNLCRRGDDGRWHRYSEVELGYAPNVHALAFDRQGALWVGAASGLYRYPAGEPDFKTKPILAGRLVRELLVARDGAIWAGTPDGLFRVDQQGAVPVRDLPRSTVTSLAEDSAGRIWATTRANGITLVTRDRTRTFNESNGLPALPFTSVLDGGNGSLWFSSPAGVFEISLAHIDEMLERRRARIEAIFYGKDDGLRTIECQNVGYPAAWKDAAGNLWFTTVRGMVSVMPRIRRALAAPRLIIEGVERKDRSHTVRFTAVRLSAAERVEVRYRLEDADPGWLMAGSERLIRYNNLSSGSHRLLVSARDAGGLWGTQAVVELYQPPRIHETWWFRALAGLAAIGLALLLYRWRAYFLRKRYALVLAERNRIAREWHDTLLAGFSAISWQLDVASEQITEQPEKAPGTLAMARAMIQHYRAEARRVVWDLHNDALEPQPLDQSILEALKETIRDRGIQFYLRVEGTPVPLTPELSQNLLRICQEAAANAVHHASASRIDACLGFADGHVSATVQDDGAGFDTTAATPGHMGLAIMRERARRFGGNVDITSRPGGGTTVTATIPLVKGRRR